MGGDYGPVRTRRCAWKMGVTVFLSKVFLLDKGTSTTQNTKYFRIFGCDSQTIISQTSMSFLHFFFFIKSILIKCKIQELPCKKKFSPTKRYIPINRTFGDKFSKCSRDGKSTHSHYLSWNICVEKYSGKSGSGDLTALLKSWKSTVSEMYSKHRSKNEPPPPC